MWQEISIFIIGLLVIAYIGRKLYILLTCNHKGSPKACQGCCGCSLKKENFKSQKHLKEYT